MGEPGVVVHNLIPVLGSRGRQCSGFEDALVYRTPDQSGLHEGTLSQKPKENGGV